MKTKKKSAGWNMAEMLAEPGSPHNVLLHLLAKEAPDSLSEHELWAQIKRVTPWSLSTLRGILVELQARSLVRKEGGGWTVGGEFEPHADEVAAAVANKIAGRHNKPAIGHKLSARYDALLTILNRHDRTAIATTQLLNELGDATNLRTLQRDLVQLEKQGLVSRNDEGWFRGQEMSDEMFEDRARAVALKLMVESFEGAVPAEIQKSLRKPLANARKKLETLTSSDPRIRWLSALRIKPSQHPLGDPMIDPDIQSAIEESILNKTKIQLQWSARNWTMSTAKSRSETGSISHYLLELPLRPAIAFWPDADESGRCVRIQVEDIESATVASQAASWPNGYEPVLVPGQMGFQTGDASANNGRSLVVLRVTAESARYLQNKRLGANWTVVHVEEDGWLIVSFRAHVDIPLYQYLKGLSGVVILRPSILWKFAQLDHKKALQEYVSCFKLVGQHQADEAREEKEPLDAAEG